MKSEFQRGYGLARAIFEKQENLSVFIPKGKILFQKYAKTEIEKLILNHLLDAMESGAICIDQSQIKNLPLQITEDVLESLRKHHIVLSQGKFYFQRVLDSEKRIASHLNAFFSTPPQKHKSIELDTEISISEEQKAAIQHCLEHSFSIITGGPGTGKTTILKMVIENLLNIGYQPEKIKIAAPTGKAAKRLSQSLGSIFSKYSIEPPSTLHRLLGHNPSTNICFYNSENPLNAKIILMDESSMADIYIMDALLNAFSFSEDSKLIFVGDPDQLLSVNHGAIFSDLVELEKNQVKLTKTFRQSKEGHEISALVKDIKAQKANTLSQFTYKDKTPKLTGVSWMNCLDTKEYEEALTIWYQTFKNENAQILTPFNKGELGIEGINAIFLNNVHENIPYILTSNLPEHNLFNGEIGILLENNGSYIFKEKEKISQSSNEVIIPFHLKHKFLPAFAITIHRSQGSEYDHVCLVLPLEQDSNKKKDSILTRRLLYTAVTRAKKSLCILGPESSWNKSILNQEFERTSGLKFYWKDQTFHS
jgi:exodeoxyribonuclease V alpha subunit